MADSALLALSAASTLDGTELYYTVQSGADRKATGAQIKTLVLANSTGTGSVVVMNTSPTLVTPVLGAAAATTVSVGANGGTGGAVTLFGSSTGSCRVTVSSLAGSVTLVLPVTNGGVNSVMVSNGSGVLSFAAGSGGGDMVAANNLSDVASTVTARSNLGVAIGTNVQAYDAQLSSLVQQNSQSATYTTVASDSGKHILHPSTDNNPRTFTIAANASVAYSTGTVLTFVNEINTVTIAINTDTLTLAGTGSTGSRTLAANGMATALKIASTKWMISGTGLT